MSDRQRRYRERRKIGIKVETFEVDHALLHEKLVGSGRMAEEDDRSAVQTPAQQGAGRPPMGALSCGDQQQGGLRSHKPT